MEKITQFSFLDLDAEIRFKLVQKLGFVKTKEEMLRIEKNYEKLNVFIFENKKTKEILKISQFYMSYTTGGEVNFDTLRKVRKQQNLYRRHMIKALGDPYKKALKETLYLDFLQNDKNLKADRKKELENSSKLLHEEIKEKYHKKSLKVINDFREELISCGLVKDCEKYNPGTIERC